LRDQVHELRWYILGALSIPLLIACALLVEDRIDDPEQLVVVAGDESAPDIRVFVAGAVERPGVYPLSANARWVDAVEAAGGATSDADLAAVNLARRVEDADHIVIPGAEVDPAVLGAVSNPSIIDINSATQEQLESLPGIGEVRASRIIASREADGLFEQVEDLILRDLIPDSVYQEIEPTITAD
jgi:competence protein ComEA